MSAETNPYEAPKAELGAVKVVSPARIGLFWGALSAIPMLFLAGMGALMAVVDPKDRLVDLAITLCALLVSLLVLGSGWLRATRRWTRPWMTQLYISPLFGAAWLAGFLGPSVVYRGVILHQRLTPDPRDWTITCWVWFWTSAYALLQGLMIQWRLGVHARRAVAARSAEAEMGA
jgi:hypothetical protein